MPSGRCIPQDATCAQRSWIGLHNVKCRSLVQNKRQIGKCVHHSMFAAKIAKEQRHEVWVGEAIKTQNDGSEKVEKRDSKKIVEELQQRLRSAVIAERDENMAALASQYLKSTTKQLERAGNVLLNLTATFDGNLFRSKRIKLQASSTYLHRHKFEQGDPIVMSSMEEVSPDDKHRSIKHEKMSCTVLEVNSEFLIVVLDDESPSQIAALGNTGIRWRLDKGHTDATSKRQLKAIECLGGRPKSVQEAAIQALVIGLDYPASIVLDNVPPWVSNGHWRKESGRRLKGIQGLNDSQRLAIALSQKQLLTLWQGPPGSGKTWSLLNLIDVVCTANRAVPEHSCGQLLVCSDTNTAVDNLVEGLIQKGIKVVRVGPPAKVREGLRCATLDALVQRKQGGVIAAKHLRDADEVYEDAQKEKDVYEREGLYQRAGQLRWQANELIERAEQEVLDESEVIACTCSKAGDQIVGDRSYRMMIIDEATQCTEASTLVPLVKGAECLVLAGDPKQLPPTVLSSRGVEAGLTVTLFDRLTQRGLEPCLLDTQYRMHAAISSFASQWFYKGKLKTGISEDEREMPKGVKWENPNCPVLLVVCTGHEERVKGGHSHLSYKNKTEAEVVLRVLSHVLAPGDVHDVGILTPYSGQVLELEQSMSLVMSSHTGSTVSVSSVDAYQGQEADVIIFTTVRSNNEKTLGFVKDARRLNVAITRAKRGLVVVGNPNTLSASPDWQAWLSWVKGRKCYTSASSIPQASWEVAI